MPATNWVFSLSKLTALLATVGVVCLYARGVFGVQWSEWALIAVLAIFFQVITNHRFSGCFAKAWPRS